MNDMDDVDKSDLPLARNGALFYSYILIGGLFLLLFIISCSSHTSGNDAASKTTVDSTNLEAVKIKGITISVGDSADTVNSQIGRGIHTVATNDPTDKDSIIIVHSYVTEGKTYHISFCTALKGYYHVCKISLVKLSEETGVGIPSDIERNGAAERHMRRDSLLDKESRPKMITDEDLKRDGNNY